MFLFLSTASSLATAVFLKSYLISERYKIGCNLARQRCDGVGDIQGRNSAPGYPSKCEQNGIRNLIRAMTKMRQVRYFVASLSNIKIRRDILSGSLLDVNKFPMTFYWFLSICNSYFCVWNQLWTKLLTNSFLFLIFWLDNVCAVCIKVASLID